MRGVGGARLPSASPKRMPATTAVPKGDLICAVEGQVVREVGDVVTAEDVECDTYGEVLVGIKRDLVCVSSWSR